MRDGGARMSPLCLVPGHPHLKMSTETFLEGTKRMPHHPDHEVVTESIDGERIHWRNCADCDSTVVLTFDAATEVRS